MLLRRTLAVLVAVAAACVAVPGTAHAATYSAPLTTAISDLPVATESRTGYNRDLFPHWIDADGDGCSTRNEVLISEADDPVTVGSGCSLSGGRWFSYYDRVSWTDTGRVDIDHMVPLAEAWDSGAGSWTTVGAPVLRQRPRRLRSLVGVTDTVNQTKGDQDPAEWLPTYDNCRYLREWVAVKHRWRLSVDSAEKSALQIARVGLHERHDHGDPGATADRAAPSCRSRPSGRPPAPLGSSSCHLSSTAARPACALSTGRHRCTGRPSACSFLASLVVPDRPAQHDRWETT